MLRDCGRADDMRLGEPMFVCLGVDARAGGKRGVLRMCSVSSTSGAEPVRYGMLATKCLLATDEGPFMVVFVLSCRSIAWELEVPCACFSGEVGDEKMPDIGSMPYSSRTPVSIRTIPVLLSRRQYRLSCILWRDHDSPANFANIKVLVPSPTSPARRIPPNALPSIFVSSRGRHAARYAIFFLRIQFVQRRGSNGCSRCARRVISK